MRADTFVQMGRVVLLMILLVGIVGGYGHAHASIDPAKLEKARQAVLDPEYQNEHPRYSHGEALGRGADLGTAGGGGASGSGAGTGGKLRPGKYPGERSPTGNGRYRDRGDGVYVDTREHQHAQAGSGVASFVMWGIIIAAAIILIIGIVTELRDSDADPQTAEPEARDRMQAAVDAILDKPLGDADELATRGEFAEAIHTLLLKTLRELVRSAAIRVTPAMTSREILAKLPMLADAREAFAGLITAVELTHFGDDPANTDDYQRCREQFNVFATALRAGASNNPRVQGSGTVAA